MTKRDVNQTCRRKGTIDDPIPNMERFSKDQIELMKKTYRKNLIFFGYIDHPVHINPEDIKRYSYFEIDDLQEEEKNEIKLYEKFNKQTLQSIS